MPALNVSLDLRLVLTVHVSQFVIPPNANPALQMVLNVLSAIVLKSCMMEIVWIVINHAIPVLVLLITNVWTVSPKLNSLMVNVSFVTLHASLVMAPILMTV
jgi:hypothetical protein